MGLKSGLGLPRMSEGRMVGRISLVEEEIGLEGTISLLVESMLMKVPVSGSTAAGGPWFRSMMAEVDDPTVPSMLKEPADGRTGLSRRGLLLGS